MAFVVEDGAGLSTATSYESVAGFTSYWAAGGSIGIVDVSTYTDVQIEAALMVATRYINNNYTFKGSIITVISPYQALKWPRQYVVDNEGREIATDIVPQQVKDALSEYAYTQLTNASSGGVQPSPSQSGLIKREKKKLDALEKEIEYESGTQAYTLQRYPYADNLMNGLTTGGPSSLSSYVGRSF